MADAKFGTETMHSILTAFADQLGVDPSDAETLHMSNNAVYALPKAGVVVRITRSTKLHERVHNVARLGQWLADIKAPTIRLTKGIKQPLAHGDVLATVWDLLPPADSPPTVGDLGKTLKAFHDINVTGADLPNWDPVDIARKRIADGDLLTESERDWLLGWCDRVAPQVEVLNASISMSLVHGDAHVGNLLRHPDGHTVLCDFDSTCIGPKGVDLASAARAAIRFGHHDKHDQLVKSYGYDITTDPAWPILREARDLAYVVSGVPLMSSSPAIAKEFRLRLDSVMTGDTTVRWTVYADAAKASH